MTVNPSSHMPRQVDCHSSCPWPVSHTYKIYVMRMMQNQLYVALGLILVTDRASSIAIEVLLCFFAGNTPPPTHPHLHQVPHHVSSPPPAMFGWTSPLLSLMPLYQDDPALLQSLRQARVDPPSLFQPHRKFHLRQALRRVPPLTIWRRDKPQKFQLFSPRGHHCREEPQEWQ